MKPGKRHALSGDLPPETLRPDLQPAGVLFDLFCRSYARLPDLAGEPARVAVVVAAIGHKRRIFQVTALLGPCAAGGETTPGRHLDKIRRLEAKRHPVGISIKFGGWSGMFGSLRCGGSSILGMASKRA